MSNSYQSSLLFLSNDQTSMGPFDPPFVHILMESSWKIKNNES